MIIERAASNILDHYLGLPMPHPIIVLFDDDKRDLAHVLHHGLLMRDHVSQLFDLGADSSDTRGQLRELLQNPSIGLVVLSSHAMWHGGLADYLTVNESGPTLRGRCSPVFFDAMLPLESLLRLYASDPSDNRAYLTQLRHGLVVDADYRVTAPEGTDIRFTARHWVQQEWEMLTSPEESSVDGRIVADASVFFSRVREPITLRVRGGRLTDIDCAQSDDAVYIDYCRMMEERIRDDWRNGQLAEVGLGGNAGAIVSGVIMEDEAVRRTCHFCFGDNAMYGGENPSEWHGGTVVVREPKLARVLV